MTQTRTTGWGRAFALSSSLSILALSAANATPSANPRGEAPDEGLASSALYGLGAFVSSVAYAPFKLVYAIGGTLVGGATWAVTGGDSELADSIIRPAVTGDYVITPPHLRGVEPVEFVGSTPPGEDYYAYEHDLPPVGAGVPIPTTCDALPGIPGLRFSVDDARLGGNEERVLSAVATTLVTCPGTEFRLEGHADAQGEGPYNYTLSLQRAMNVKEFLVGQGIEPSRLEAAGLGESSPASTNDTEYGRAANRRVELRVR